jgi:hypothetical protein
MAVASSTIIEDQAQVGGWRSVTERHVFDDGHVVLVHYVAAKSLDVTSYMQARVPLVEAQDTDERNRAIARALLKSEIIKTQSYLIGLSNLALTNQVGLVPGEIAVLRATAP